MTDLFDSLFKQALGLHRYADHVQRSTASTFPPFNVLVNDTENPTEYTIEVAVAGFARNQLNVRLRKDTGIPVLVIEGAKGEEAPDRIYTVRGLAARSFTREFTLSNDMKVNDVALNDGVLTIKLEVVKQKDTDLLLQIK